MSVRVGSKRLRAKALCCAPPNIECAPSSRTTGPNAREAVLRQGLAGVAGLATCTSDRLSGLTGRKSPRAGATIGSIPGGHAVGDPLHRQRHPPGIGAGPTILFKTTWTRRNFSCAKTASNAPRSRALICQSEPTGLMPTRDWRRSERMIGVRGMTITRSTGRLSGSDAGSRFGFDRGWGRSSSNL